MSSDKKKLNKTEKDRKNMVKENNNDESDFSENKIPDLNSLKPFEFEPKTNFGVLTVVRSSHQRCSVTKGILRNFAKFKEKHLCKSLPPF